jgi:hypothetical protein
MVVGEVGWEGMAELEFGPWELWTHCSDDIGMGLFWQIQSNVLGRGLMWLLTGILIPTLAMME